MSLKTMLHNTPLEKEIANKLVHDLDGTFSNDLGSFDITKVVSKEFTSTEKYHVIGPDDLKIIWFVHGWLFGIGIRYYDDIQQN